MVPLATKRATCTGNPKNQVIEVPGGEFFFMVKGNAIEGDEVPLAVDVQFPWEDSPRRYHNEVLQANLVSIFCLAMIKSILQVAASHLCWAWLWLGG